MWTIEQHFPNRLSFRHFSQAVLLFCSICTINVSRSCQAQVSVDSNALGAGLPIAGVVEYTAFPKSTVLELGDLPAGDKAEVVLEIKNSSVSEFVIKEARASCSCVDIRTSEAKIGAGKSVMLKAGVKLPKINRETSQQQLITLVGNNEGNAIQIILQYRVTGLCCFKEPQLYKTVPPGAREIELKMPVLFSIPVGVKDLSVVGTGDFVGMKAVLAQESDGVFFKCIVSLPSKDGFILNGQFQLKSKSADIVDEIQCFVGQQQKASVLPSLVHFYRDGKEWKATAIVRINKDSLSKELSSPNLSVGCVFGALAVATNVEAISRGIVRVRLTVKDSDIFKEGQFMFQPTDQLQWQIGWEGDIGEVRTAARFQN